MSNLNPQKDEENLGSFYMGRMRPPPEPKRVMPKGLLSGVTLAAFVAILWYAYPQGQEKYSGVDVPVIAADKSVYKFKPDDPGGMEVRHRDSTVFDPIDGKSRSAEKLLPTPEEPMDKEEALKSLEKPAPKLNLDMQMTEVAKGTEKVVTREEIKKAEAKKAEAKKAEAKKEELKPAPKPAPRAEEKPAAAPAPASVVAGAYHVQVGSYRDLKGAKSDWTKLQGKYPSLLGGLTAKVEKADLGKKGVWYRLYGGALSEARAREICAVLKTENPGGCIVAKK